MKNGFITNSNGDIFCYLNDEYHRLDAPAIEWADGSKFWYQDGKCHRLDGPACEYVSGKKIWYYHDKKIDCSSQEEFLRLLKLKIFW